MRIYVRRTTRATITLAAMVSMAAAALAAASPASAKPYPPPSIHLLCSAAANSGTLEGGVCVLPFGVTTAPNSYSATIAVSKVGAAGPTVTFALTAGRLPPGLTMPAQSGSSTVISGNPTQTGTFNFTVKATDGNLTATLAGHLVTSHRAGGTLSVIAGALPPGLSLAASFGAAGDVVSGTATGQGTFTFTVRGTGDQGQPLYQAYQIAVDPTQPLAVVLPASGSTLFPGTVGQAFGINFFLSGGAAPYTWTLASGQLPPGMHLQTFSDPRDANNEMTGTPTTAGTFTWTMRVTDYDGQQATQQFSITIQP